MNSTSIAIISLLISISSLVYNIWHQHKKDVLFQASKISIWQVDIKIKNNSFWCKCNINNMSNLPIYNVLVFSCWNTYDETLLKTLSNCLPIGTKFIEVIPPGSSTTTIEVHDNGMGNQHDVPAILFTDSQNIQWYRHANGKLEKKRYVNLLLKNNFILGHLEGYDVLSRFNNFIFRHYFEIKSKYENTKHKK